MLVRKNNRSNIKKTVKSTDLLVKDAFVTSVAKGEVITLSSTWSKSIEYNISGEIAPYTLGIKDSVTKTYTKTQSFSGPTDSAYNTRMYKVKFYEQRETYSADWLTGSINNGTLKMGTETGTFSEPTHYVSYSIDKYVQ